MKLLLSEKQLNKIIRESINKFLIKEWLFGENKNSQKKKEEMLVGLYNYLSQEPTDDIFDGDTYLDSENRKAIYINTKYKAYNYFEPKGIVHNVWGVHFTNVDGYEGIQKRGFRIGVSDNDALAYSRAYYNYEQPRKSGWDFALPIDRMKYLSYGLK